jgi:hypothetical protein
MVVNSNFTGVLKKFSGTLWYLVKFGCVTHCVMEYFGDFVFVSVLTYWSTYPSVYNSIGNGTNLILSKFLPK